MTQFKYMTKRNLEIAGSGGAIYLPYLVLHHTAWSKQKGMSTFKGLEA